MEYDTFVNLHGPQLYGSGVPEGLWRSIRDKLSNTTMDAADYVQYAEDEDGSLVAVAKRSMTAGSVVFLIDHAWTFKLDAAKPQLRSVNGLLERVEGLVGATPASDATLEQRVDAAWERLWRYVQTYRVATEEQMDPEAVWYLDDELGCRFDHDGDPNFRFAPLFYVAEQAAYTLAWPVKDIEEGELLSRDMLRGADNETGQRQVRELVWLDDEEALAMCRGEYQKMAAGEGPTFRLPATSSPKEGAQVLPPVEKYRIFTDNPILRNSALHPQLQFCDDLSQAHIVWCDHNRLDLGTLNANQIVNQFPLDECLSAKEQLSYTVRAKWGRPPWLPTTYDSSAELAAFVGDFLSRRQAQEDNAWIVKPHRMARSMDVYVSNSMDCLLRLSETGPRVICKYIHQPVTIGRKKFSVRFTVMVKSFAPLEAYVYEKFTLSCSPNNFSLDHLDDYKTHTTVMLYRQEADRECETKLKCDAFVEAFTEEYGPGQWETARHAAQEVLRQALEAGAHRGMHHPASRALYGADVMWAHPGLQPRLLELTYAPDCHRIAERCPSFYTDVFSTLLFGQPVNVRPLVGAS